MKLFSYLVLLAAGIFALMIPCGSAVADDHATIEISDDLSVTFSGSIRSRFEWSENSDFTDMFDDESGMVPSRYRLGLRFDMPSDVSAVFDMQSLQTFGEGAGSRTGGDNLNMPSMFPSQPGGFGIGPGVVAHDDDFALYQGYVEANEIGGSSFSLRIGRQELVYGTEFLLGDNDFYGGLSHDGIKAIFEFSNDSSLDVFWMKLDEMSRVDASDEDADLYGAYFQIPSIGGGEYGVDAYILGMRSGMDTPPFAGNTSLNMYTLGVRVFRAAEYGLHFNAELAFQSGDFTPAGVELDVDAYAFEGSIGWAFDFGGNPDLHVGYTTASGDSDGGADGDWDAFNPLFQDAHPRNGLADFFGTSNIEIIQLGYAGSFENHGWGVDLYDVSLEEVVGGAADDLGQELDLHYSYQYSDNLALNFVYSLVMPDDVIEATMGDDDLQRIYANLVVSF